MKRPTLRDIAVRAGVTVSCVSQALRGLKAASESRRREIHRIADEIGYRPDPALSALAAYRSRNRPAVYRSTIAVVTDGNRCPHLAAATRRAETLGYRLDVFPVRNPLETWALHLRIFAARGVQGILLTPRLRFDENFPEADLHGFVLATVGYSVRLPGIVRVSTNQFRDMVRHVGALHDLGYQRLAAWIPGSADHRVEGQFSGGFLTAVPDASARILREENPSRAVLVRWIQGERIDAVIGLNHHPDLLRRAGFGIPGRLGFSSLDWWATPSLRPLAGMDYRPAMLMERAVDVLHAGLLANRRGLDPDAPVVLHDAVFRPGRSLRS